ncbi:hypothetical protein [Microvirga sesbaniae]|uniref:hypothetical protein n=1 Tax=Microvirga sesbaniae TaxID=681392 RepID=UPI0021C99C07|nr:hypothetical protein [Microvirga sp. HBU67692]
MANPVRTYPEQAGQPGTALYSAWVSGLIDRGQYEAGRRLVDLWQKSDSEAAKARLSAARTIMPLGDGVAYVLSSVCRDNGGLGCAERANLLRLGLSALSSHFANGMEVGNA